MAAYWNDLYAFLLNASGALMLFVYLGVAASQLILRPKTAEKLHIRAWFHPWGGYLTIFAMLAVLVAMALSPHGSRAELSASLILRRRNNRLFIFRRKRAT